MLCRVSTDQGTCKLNKNVKSAFFCYRQVTVRMESTWFYENYLIQPTSSTYLFSVWITKLMISDNLSGKSAFEY